MKLLNILLHPVRTAGHGVLRALDAYRNYRSDPTWKKLLDELQTLGKDLEDGITNSELEDEDREVFSGFIVAGKYDDELVHKGLLSHQQRRWATLSDYLIDFVDMQRQQALLLSGRAYLQYCLLISQIVHATNHGFAKRTSELMEEFLTEFKAKEDENDKSLPFFLGVLGES